MALPEITITLQTWNPRFTGALSTIGSLAIIYIILSDRSRKLMKPKNRLMLCMSIFDCFQSIALTLSTAGAKISCICQIQGILIWLGLAVPLYNSSLNLYYLLAIRYNVDTKYFSTKIEPYLHAMSILYPLTLAILNALLGLIISLDGLCWTPGSEYMVILGWGIPVFLCFLFCIFSMASIYLAVRKQAKCMDKYRFSTANDNTEQNETRNQALMYTSAFVLTYIFPFIEGITRSQKIETTTNILAILTVTFYPLQGFWNFLFYIMPGVKHVRKMNPSISLFAAIREVVFNASVVAESFRRPRATRRCNKFRPSPQSTYSNRKATNTLPDDDGLKNEVPKASRRVSFAPKTHEEDQDNTANTIVQGADKVDNANSLLTNDEERPISSNTVNDCMNGSKTNDRSERRESLSCLSSVLSLVDFEDGEDESTNRFSFSRRSSAVSFTSVRVIDDETDVDACKPYLRSDPRESSNFTPNEIESGEA